MSEVCQALEEKLIAFVDDELESPVEKALITDHVSRCDQCREIVQDLKGVGLAVHEFFDALARGPVADEQASAVAQEGAVQPGMPIPPPPSIPLAKAAPAGSGPIAPAVPVAPANNNQPSGPTKAWGYLQGNSSNNATPNPDMATSSNSWGRGWGPAASASTPPPPAVPAPPIPAPPAPKIPPAPTPQPPAQKAVPIPPPPKPLPSEPETVVLSPAPPMKPPSGDFQSAPAKSSRRASSSSLIPSSSSSPSVDEDEVTDLAELVGGQLGGYKVVREIAHGGMGTVFHAIQISMDRPIALKVLAPRLQTDEVFVRRFAREARAAAQLDHPNLVRIYDVGQARGCSFYSMELITGQDLKEILKEKISLPIEQSLKLAVQSCKAMEMALKHGIVHRDIKPANILIEDKTGDVKIADLGLAKENGASGDGAITMDKTVMGSPNYMSPEQAEDVRIADHQSDVYALGATLYHMVTGVAPYGKGKPVEILARMLTTDLDIPDPISGPPIDAALRKIIHRSMAKKREQRYPDAKSLRLDLEAYWKAYKAKPTANAMVPEAGELNRSGVTRARVKGRGSRRAYDGPAAKPSRLLMLLSSVLGFVVIALLCQIFIKPPIDDVPITDNKDAPKKRPTKVEENKDKGKSAEEEARDRKAEEARRVRFAKLMDDLKNPKKDYQVAFAGIQKIRDLTFDKDLESKIDRIVEDEENNGKRLEGLIGQCDSLKKNFVDDPEHLVLVIKKSKKLAKELNYHPLSKSLLDKVDLMKDLQKQWVGRELAALTDLIDEGQLKDVSKGITKLRDRLRNLGIEANHSEQLAALQSRLEGKKEEIRKQELLAKARAELPQIYVASYKELHMQKITNFDKRIAALKKDLDLKYKDKAEVKELVAEHILHLEQARQVMLDCRNKLCSTTKRPLIIEGIPGRKDVKVGRWLADQALGVDGKAITGKRDSLLFTNPIGSVHIHEIGTKAIINFASPTPTQTASFFALRGRFEEAREAAKKVGAEATGVNKMVREFEEMLKAYDIAGQEKLVAELNKRAEELFKKLKGKSTKRLVSSSRLQSTLNELLSGKYANTDVVKANKEQLDEWKQAVTAVSSVPKSNGSYAYWTLKQEKLAKGNKLFRRFRSSAVSKPPMEDHYTVLYDFTNVTQRKAFKTRQFFGRDLRGVFKIPEEAGAFGGRKAWEIHNDRLWGKGLNPIRHKAPIEPGYLRVEIEALPYSDANLSINLGLHGDGKDWEQGFVTVSALHQTPRVTEERMRNAPYMRQWNEANEARARVFMRESGPNKFWQNLFVSEEAPKAFTPVPTRFCVEVLPYERFVKLVGADKVPEKVKDRPYVLVAQLKRKDSPWELVIPPMGLEFFPEGNVGLETIGSCIVYNRVEITAKFEEEWLEDD